MWLLRGVWMARYSSASPWCRHYILRAPRMRLIMESYNSAFVSIDGSLSRSSSHPPPPSPPQVIFHPPFFWNSSSSHLCLCSSSSQTAFKAICSATFLSSFSPPSHLLLFLLFQQFSFAFTSLLFLWNQNIFHRILFDKTESIVVVRHAAIHRLSQQKWITDNISCQWI